MKLILLGCNLFFNSIIQYWEENIDKTFKKDRDKRIAWSILELMDRVDTIEIFNKVDLLNKDEYEGFNGENTIFVSAKNGSGIDQIKYAICKELDQKYLNTKLSFNNNYGPITNWLYENCKIISKKNTDFDRYNYNVKITKTNLEKLKIKYPCVEILS